MKEFSFKVILTFLFVIIYTNLNNFSFAQMPPQQYVPSSFLQYGFPQAPSYNFPAPSTFSFPGQPSPQVQGSFAIPQNFQQPQFIPSYSPPGSANTFIAPPLAPTQQQAPIQQQAIQQQATQPQVAPQTPPQQQAIQPELPTQPQPQQQAIQPEPPSQPQPQQQAIQPELPTQPQPQQQAIQPELPTQPQPQQQAIQPEPPTQPQAPDLPQNASNVAKQRLVKIFDAVVCNSTTCTGCDNTQITSRIGSPFENCCRTNPGNTGCN